MPPDGQAGARLQSWGSKRLSLGMNSAADLLTIVSHPPRSHEVVLPLSNSTT